MKQGARDFKTGRTRPGTAPPAACAAGPGRVAADATVGLRVERRLVHDATEDSPPSSSDRTPCWMSTSCSANGLVVKTALGTIAATDLLVRFCTIDDGTVRPGVQPVFATRKDGPREVFFARLNNSTEELSGSALLDYRQKHWPE